MKLIVLDTETSGFKEPSGVCECAIIELDPDTLDEVARHRSLIDPQVPIQPGASGIHRITDDMVVDSPTLEEFFHVVLEKKYENEPMIMVAHNAQFDHKYVKPYLPLAATLCTLRLARVAYPDADDHKLPTLKYMFKLGSGGISHSALGDVEDTVDLLRLLCHELDMNIPALVEFQHKPKLLTKMPFGKDWKGKPIRDVPVSFLQWALKQPNPDVDLVYTIETLGLLKFNRRA